jgi:hypothetical protein
MRFKAVGASLADPSKAVRMSEICIRLSDNK